MTPVQPDEANNQNDRILHLENRLDKLDAVIVSLIGALVKSYGAIGTIVALNKDLSWSKELTMLQIGMGDALEQAFKHFENYESADE
ncbi:MAG: hypothetical protein WDN46_17415 [Methylocella sp.]